MSDFAGFRESYIKSESETLSGSDSVSPPPNELTKQQSLHIPSINVKNENVDNLLSKSLDIKKQLSQSFQGGGGGSFGGVTKPQSRKNSVMAIKSNHGSDNEDDDDDGQGNERKRRDNINDKIQELLTLIPAEFFQDSAAEISRAKDDKSEEAEIAAAVKNSGTKDGKPNKGQILTKSVEYLQYLQNMIDENNRKEVELIMKLKSLELQLQGKSADVPISVGHTSAERALGKIGVGPLSDDYFKMVLVNSANTNKSGQRRGSVS
ncbi:uncharacterized protein CANTADRAFT_54267 [Suhomyces tanzawaensis NRRL Y-17324]|uniref:BHLH domain-containing protein n=1 Tax=Suhomyces tanzawaensis NRRL Y-17324 TaxID=984487 RepID=A0A1E4SEL1_9ASCO|nr:uncharacterized protein CANTADRAFT_54267 [Suhomyces tanzawaensis NRRL Y-17324]ODV77947.1 hypothetical protein CANTADRAFT_54267 [Suhomyces tanzawaensis NRRL Y-17324]